MPGSLVTDAWSKGDAGGLSGASGLTAHDLLRHHFQRHLCVTILFGHLVRVGARSVPTPGSPAPPTAKSAVHRAGRVQLGQPGRRAVVRVPRAPLVGRPSLTRRDSPFPSYTFIGTLLWVVYSAGLLLQTDSLVSERRVQSAVLGEYVLAALTTHAVVASTLANAADAAALGARVRVLSLTVNL